MKITTISVECKKCFAYQTFSVGLTAELAPGEDEAVSIRILQAQARAAVVEQIELEKPRGGRK